MFNRQLLRSKMSARSISPAILADRMGVTPAAVNYWLAGSREPSARCLMRLSRELGLPPGDLLQDA